MVCLLRGGRLFRRVRGGPRPASRDKLPASVPLRWDHGVHGVHAGALADVHLVPPRMDHYHQVDHRRAHLRATHCRHVWMAVAPVAQFLSYFVCGLTISLSTSGWPSTRTRWGLCSPP